MIKILSSDSLYSFLLGAVLGSMIFNTVINVSIENHTHAGVPDDYSHGFYNCLAIMEKRYPQQDWSNCPTWKENKRSYEEKRDLYNYWDSSFQYSEFYLKLRH